MKKVAERNWALVVTAVIVIVVNLAIIVVTVLCLNAIGWWAIALLLAAASGIGMAVMAIRTNEPSWLMLDLIMPQ